jgi:carboxylesterase
MSVDRTILFPGQGRLGVLLVHGLGGTPVEMKTFGRRLVDAGATVLCCQLAGHCGTEEELKATSWQDWYASVAQALTRLEEHCDTVVVGGLSMGALLAARLAREEPDRVHGLIMLAPTFRYDGWSIPWYSFLLKLLMPTPIGARYRFVEREPFGVKDERIRALVVRAMNSGDPTNAGLLATPSQAVQEMWRLAAELRPTLGRIHQPTFLAHARQDDIASLRNAFTVQRELGGRVETLVLEDSYHLVTVDRQRGLVGQRAADFVRTLAAERPVIAKPVLHAV